MDPEQVNCPKCGHLLYTVVDRVPLAVPEKGWSWRFRVDDGPWEERGAPGPPAPRGGVE